MKRKIFKYRAKNQWRFFFRKLWTMYMHKNWREQIIITFYILFKAKNDFFCCCSLMQITMEQILKRISKEQNVYVKWQLICKLIQVLFLDIHKWYFHLFFTPYANWRVFFQFYKWINKWSWRFSKSISPIL